LYQAGKRVEPQHAPGVGQLGIEAMADPSFERNLDSAREACLTQDDLQPPIQFAAAGGRGLIGGGRIGRGGKRDVPTQTP
jgi:hypothetical protein